MVVSIVAISIVLWSPGLLLPHSHHGHQGQEARLHQPMPSGNLHALGSDLDNHASSSTPEVFCNMVAVLSAQNSLQRVDGSGRCESVGSVCAVEHIEKWMAHRSCVLKPFLDACTCVRCLRGRWLGISLSIVFDTRVFSYVFHPSLEIFKVLLVLQSSGMRRTI